MLIITKGEATLPSARKRATRLGPGLGLAAIGAQASGPGRNQRALLLQGWAMSTSQRGLAIAIAIKPSAALGIESRQASTTERRTAAAAAGSNRGSIAAAAAQT